MSYYTERNGLAKFWDMNDMGQVISNYARYHPEEIDFNPELFQLFVQKLIAAGIDITHTYQDNSKYNIEVYFDKIDQLSDQEIDNITGVNLNV